MFPRYLWLLLQVALHAIAAAILFWLSAPFDWRIVAIAPYTLVAAFYPIHANEYFGRVSAAAFALTFVFYFLARKHGALLTVIFLLHLANLGLLLFLLFATSRG